VLCGLFDLFDAGDVQRAPVAERADVGRRFDRHDAGAGHRFGRRRLDEQPGLVPALVAPDAAHFWVCVAWDHRR